MRETETGLPTRDMMRVVVGDMKGVAGIGAEQGKARWRQGQKVMGDRCRNDRDRDEYRIIPHKHPSTCVLFTVS